MAHPEPLSQWSETVSSMLPKLSRPQAKVLAYWSYNADDKKGKQRRDLEVSSCFGPLLQWLLAWWPADQPRLALALDATTLKKRFTVLCISVVYRGCAIPVAWKVVGAEQKGAWQPYWLDLLQHLAGCVPEHWTVIVMSDRGLDGPWLYGQILELRWPPVMRSNNAGNFPSTVAGQICR